MHDYMVEEMAETIEKELHVDRNDVLRILHGYWCDKIALVWQVDDILDCALNAGKPITRADAVELLQHIFEDHDSDQGITWLNLELELQEYHLSFERLPADQYNEVHGVFKVWQEGNPIAHQFGLFPDKVTGNLPKALECAKSMADETPNLPVLIGCERQHSDKAEPWLSVLREKDEVQINESGEKCTQ
jgi:hypothetical protein